MLPLVKFNVLAVPPIVKLDVDEPVKVPDVFTITPFKVSVFEPTAKDPLVKVIVPFTVVPDVKDTPPELLIVRLFTVDGNRFPVTWADDPLYRYPAVVGNVIPPVTCIFPVFNADEIPSTLSILKFPPAAAKVNAPAPVTAFVPHASVPLIIKVLDVATGKLLFRVNVLPALVEKFMFVFVKVPDD